MRPIELNGLLWNAGNVIIDRAKLLKWDISMAAVTDGHRLPTKDEWQDLAALGSTWDDDRPGRWFGPDHELRENSEQSVFLPADGFRTPDGTLYNAGYDGYYWSASPYDGSNAYYLSFHRGYVGPANTNYRTFGFSVRLVREIH
jgi:uncharacterized protein (TIGR02145 family)